MDLLKSLIVVSEKAANIARLCRQNEHLFKLLIQRKVSGEANPRFVEDFKTLADVLIQEMVKYDIGADYPSLKNSIRGEENNTFSNKLGETIMVEIKEKESETADLLYNVLNGNRQAADLLSCEVHKSVNLCDVNTQIIPQDFQLDMNELGIWIDPIDSTVEYIHGDEKIAHCGINTSGLKCVTVLIGVYNKKTGLPVIGVINQPFVTQERNKWFGMCFWGISSIAVSYSSFDFAPKPSTKIICISSSESSEVKNKLEKNSVFELVEAAGAGYKILSVILGLTDAYVLSKSSTFKWDTCGPQAILKAIGGDIIVFKKVLSNQRVSIKYDESDNCCNEGGIIVYRNSNILDEIIKCLT